MAMALVQPVVVTATAGSPATSALGSAPLSGSTVAVAGATNGTTRHENTPTDNFGDTGGTAWTLQKSASDANVNTNLYLWTRVIGSGASGTTVSVTNDGGGHAIYVAEYSGGDSGGAVDGTSTSGNGSGGTPQPSAAITTTVASDVIIGIIGKAGAIGTAGAGYTREATDGTFSTSGYEDRITTSTGNYTPDWSATGNDWVTIAIALKGASAAAAKTPWPFHQGLRVH